MATLPRLTENLVREMAPEEIYRRGLQYYKAGAVSNLVQRGNLLTAEVEGSEYEPYRVAVTLDAEGVEDAECTCPYDWGGPCKHVIATLLHYINKQGETEERPPLDLLLAPLTEEQLRHILLILADEQPDLADSIEAQVVTLTSVPAIRSGKGQPKQAQTQPQAQAQIDPAPFRRQVRNALRSTGHMSNSEAYWYTGGIAREVYSVAKQAVPFLEAGNGRSAIAILEAVTEEYVAEWFDLDDSDGELGNVFGELGALWAEAILTADLTPAERKKWRARLSKWQAEVGEYGIDEAFQAAEAAAEQGWDYPPIKRVLAGKVTNQGAWDTGHPPWYADDLAVARLNVLERQGRTQEYLYLSEAEGQMDLYLIMLVKLGRVEQAMKEALESLATVGEALYVAKALRERGATEEAIRIAEHGLQLDGNHVELARWLRDLAGSVGQGERALGAALAALREVPSLADYLAVQQLAGEQWPKLRDELLTYLRKKALTHYHTQPYIEIFLHEGLVDDAIATLAATQYPHYSLVEMVADTAISTHPEWVIENAWKQALEIIGSGKSSHYQSAARWIERARDSSAVLGRSNEWRAKVEELLTQHKRKYSLTPLLQALLKRR